MFCFLILTFCAMLLCVNRILRTRCLCAFAARPHYVTRYLMHQSVTPVATLATVLCRDMLTQSLSNSVLAAPYALQCGASELYLCGSELQQHTSELHHCAPELDKRPLSSIIMPLNCIVVPLSGLTVALSCIMLNLNHMLVHSSCSMFIGRCM